MTALSDYDRLEAPGLWRAGAEAQSRDVIVSLAEATLIISDSTEAPLSHWSLPAITRLNPGVTPALYAPGREEDSSERLELDDPTMIDAIERIRRAIDRHRPRPGRLRGSAAALSLGLIALIALAFLPQTLQTQTLRVATPASRTAVGEALAQDVARITGPACHSLEGDRALETLATRLGLDGLSLRVFPGGSGGARLLPGGLIALDHRLVEDHEDPAVAAGYVLDQLATHRDPLAEMLAAQGSMASFRMLTSGQPGGRALRAEAERVILNAPPAPVTADITALLDRFAQAQVPVGPFARALELAPERNPQGPRPEELLARDPVAEAPPLLSAEDWRALQYICE